MTGKPELPNMEPKNGSGPPQGLTIIIGEDLRVHSWELLVPGHILYTRDVSCLTQAWILHACLTLDLS